MNYDEFQRRLGKAVLSAREFAEILKMNRNSVTNYSKSGEVPAHLAVIVTLMGEMAERKIEFRTVLASIEIEHKKPRGTAAIGRFGGSKQAELEIGQ